MRASSACLGLLLVAARGAAPDAEPASCELEGVARGLELHTEEEIDAIERAEAAALDIRLLQARVHIAGSSGAVIQQALDAGASGGVLFSATAASAAAANESKAASPSEAADRSLATPAPSSTSPRAAAAATGKAPAPTPPGPAPVVVAADGQATAGGPASAQEALTGHIGALAPAGQVADACTGDGTSNENPNCKFNPSRSGCTWTPGCNWAGESHFNGWCSGSASCAYTSGSAACHAIGACKWIAAARPVNMTAEMLADRAAAADLAHALNSGAPPADGDDAAPHAGAATSGPSRHSATEDRGDILSYCRGDGSRWEAYYCKYIPFYESCVMALGCNWRGHSRFGGWCLGGPFCAANPSRAMCEYMNCDWVPAVGWS